MLIFMCILAISHPLLEAVSELADPKSHSYFNLDHCCHINAGTLSILYWLVG